MTRLIEQLQGRDTQGTARMVELAPIVARRGRAQPVAPARGHDATAQLDAACRCTPIPSGSTSVIEHVMRNAQEATAAAAP